ncbi:MAG: hypothetical protein RLZZ117_603 [Cyanobacteriota bacterium]
MSCHWIDLDNSRMLGIARMVNTPKGIRTPVASVKGRCPRPLDDGGEATAFSGETIDSKRFR